MTDQRRGGGLSETKMAMGRFVADVPGRKIDSATNTARNRSDKDNQNRVVK
jgi:hypothetical protein